MDVDEQKQYKVQLLLHVNSLLLARALRLSQQQDQRLSRTPHNKIYWQNYTY